MKARNKGKDKHTSEKPSAQLRIIETETLSRVVDSLMEKIIRSNAIKVFAGYAWARNRNFDEVYDPKAFEEDKKYGEQLLKETYKGETLPLKDLIRKMIDKQAEVIWWRRVLDGRDPGYSTYLYERDRWEAKRYIAYLFFEELRKNCVQKGICPDLALSLKGQIIIDLLKSLTIEEYCKIKGYLAFLDRRQNNGGVVHGLENHDYMLAMKDLDSSFLNCNCRARKQFTAHAQKIVIVKDCEEIKNAKYNTRDRLGHMDRLAIELFVDKYCAFVNAVFSNSVERNEAVVLLTDLYHNSNSKIINMVEFFLKCLIASYVDETVHSRIRINSHKSALVQIDKTLYRNQQIMPLF